MKPFKFSYLGGALLLGFVATNAEALVIYNWYDVASNSNVGPINASMAFDESVWAFGGEFNYHSAYSSDPVPYFGVAAIDFATASDVRAKRLLSQGFTDPIQLRTSQCGQSALYGFDPGVYCAARGLDVDDLVVSAGNWTFDLKFGEFLTGSMYLNDRATDVRMKSQDQLFTIAALDSDSPGACFKPTLCDGGTGYWKLLKVDEPNTVLLLSLGLISLAAIQRRRLIKPKRSTLPSAS
ncbi:MAG: hypothetical protein HY273_10050 [Gammaproteobacteria bacterium]|nr:hypothetical protein [Gammaproteobacteria bacterium]